LPGSDDLDYEGIDGHNQAGRSVGTAARGQEEVARCEIPGGIQRLGSPGGCYRQRARDRITDIVIVGDRGQRNACQNNLVAVVDVRRAVKTTTELDDRARNGDNRSRKTRGVVELQRACAVVERDIVCVRAVPPWNKYYSRYEGRISQC
jgi:hypothetical protein